MNTRSATARWGTPDDAQACLALAILSQDQHAQLGVARPGQTDFWRWRVGEASKGGRTLLGPRDSRRVEAWRLIVSDDRVPDPLGLDHGAGLALVGMLLAVLHGPVLESGETGPLACRIDNAYVRPGYRRRGHTARMLEFLAGWAEMFEVPALDLQVAEANDVGRATWVALGFRVSDRPADAGFVAMSRAARAG